MNTFISSTQDGLSHQKLQPFRSWEVAFVPPALANSGRTTKKGKHTEKKTGKPHRHSTGTKLSPKRGPTKGKGQTYTT